MRSQIDLFKRAPAAADTGDTAAGQSTPADITPDESISESPPAPDVDPCGGQPGGTPLYGLRIVALDFETTGLAAERGDAVCEVGLVAGTGDRVEVLMSQLVNPDRPISVATARMTGIEDRHLVDAPRLSQLMPRILELISSRPLVMHNAPFDLHFLQKAVAIAGLPALNNLAIDTLLMARFLGRSREGNSLRKAAEYYGVRCGEVHRAADDA